MAEMIWIEPVWQLKEWFEKPIFKEGETAYIEDIGMCLFKADCWAELERNGAMAEVEILCANHEIEELQECAG